MTKKHPTNKRIRSTGTTMLIVTVIILLMAAGAWGQARYTREATVTKVIDNTITVVDKCGYVWSFKGDDFKVNDEVKLMMDNNNTDSNICDDRIIDAEIK